MNKEQLPMFEHVKWWCWCRG